MCLRHLLVAGALGGMLAVWVAVRAQLETYLRGSVQDTAFRPPRRLDEIIDGPRRREHDGRRNGSFLFAGTPAAPSTCAPADGSRAPPWPRSAAADRLLTTFVENAGACADVHPRILHADHHVGCLHCHGTHCEVPG